jgi:hypothetical protein
VTQMEIFGRAPYSNDSTSKEAAASIEPHLDRLEAVVVGAIDLYGPLACFEVEEKTGLEHTTASARIRTLVKKNRLRDTGHKRKTPRGRNAIVWAIV